MFSVAIDGPAGAGKSTIAKAAAGKLGFIYIDTGALYRATALGCIRHGADPSDKDAVEAALSKLRIGLAFSEGTQRVMLDGRDVSGEIRREEISMAASAVSAIPEVRAFLLGLQRELAEKNNVIMDGRDIGTVVLPHAQVKIFLTASPESRAQRRTDQLIEKGETPDYERILKDIIKRDNNDMNREIAPLRPAEDSITVDTTELTLEGSINAVLEIIKGRMQ